MKFLTRFAAILILLAATSATASAKQWVLVRIEKPDPVTFRPGANDEARISGQARIEDGAYRAQYVHISRGGGHREFHAEIGWPSPPRIAGPGATWTGTARVRITKADAPSFPGPGNWRLDCFISADLYSRQDGTRTTEIVNKPIVHRHGASGEAPIRYEFPPYDGRSILKIRAAGRITPPDRGSDLTVIYVYEWGEPVEEKVDLQIRDFFVTYFEARGSSGVDFIEESADRHAVFIRVYNNAPEASPAGIATLWDAPPRQAGAKRIGEEVTVPSIPSRREQTLRLTWPLSGPVTNARLFAHVEVPNRVDSAPADNVKEAAGPITIRYAMNGRRAYAMPTDAYAFKNYGVETSAAEGMVELWLAKALHAGPSADHAPEVLRRLIFPQTWSKFSNYVSEISDMGSGGHCHGMAATSALYFEDDALRPVAKATSAMTRAEAAADIAFYQIAQYNGLFRHLAGENLDQRTYQPAFDVILDRLTASPRPALVYYFGPNWGHAVLAYKIVKNGQHTCVYTYDPNYPVGSNPNLIPSFVALRGQTIWMPFYTSYANTLKSVYADEVRREIVPEATREIMPLIRGMLAKMRETIASGKVMVSLRCPADALIRDAEGRTTGRRNGRPVNAIPGAEVIVDGEVEAYLLPSGREYTITVARRGEGAIHLDLFRPGADRNEVALTAFDAIALPPRGSGALRLGTDNNVSTLTIGNRELGSNLEAVIRGEAVTVTKAENVATPQAPRPTVGRSAAATTPVTRPPDGAPSAPTALDFSATQYRHPTGAFRFPVVAGWQVKERGGRNERFDGVMDNAGSIIQLARDAFPVTAANADAELDAYVEKVMAMHRRAGRRDAEAKRIRIGGAPGVAILHGRDNLHLWNILVVRGNRSYQMSITVPAEGAPALPDAIEQMLSQLVFP